MSKSQFSSQSSSDYSNKMALSVKFNLALLFFVIMAAAANSDMSPDPEADSFIQQADEKVSKSGTSFNLERFEKLPFCLKCHLERAVSCLLSPVACVAFDGNVL